MHSPKVTAITVYYNREYCVDESVQSLLAQTCPNLEILLVDDGSTDATLSRFNHFINDPRVKIITGPNRGFTIALESAIRDHASGEYIAIHGSGDVSHPTRMEKQATILNNSRDVCVVGCYYQNIIEGEIKGKLVQRDSTHQSLADLVGKDGCRFSHGEVMFRRSVYEKVGGYRPFFRFAQDYDLWLRMREHGKFAHVTEMLYDRYYRPNGVAKNFSNRLLQHYYIEFGKQCAEARIRGAKDLLVAYGSAAPLYCSGRWRMAYKFLGKTYLELRAGRRTNSAKAFRLFYRELVLCLSGYRPLLEISAAQENNTPSNSK